MNSGLTQELVDDVIDLSAKFKDADRIKKELNELKIEADNFIYNLEKFITENKVKIEDDESIDKIKLEEDVKNLTELLQGEEYEQIVKSYELLQKDYASLEKLINTNNKDKKKENEKESA